MVNRTAKYFVKNGQVKKIESPASMPSGLKDAIHQEAQRQILATSDDGVATSPKRMSEECKARVRQYLADFATKNGGCILCTKPIAEPYMVPDTITGEVYLYGACEQHAQLNDTDIKAEKVARKLRQTAKADGITDPVMTVIIFKKDGEERLHA